MNLNKFNRPNMLLNMKTEHFIPVLYPEYSMVTTSSMKLTVDAANTYYKNLPENDENSSVVECGVWKGGMSILLAKLFPDKKLFLCDSFKGFEPIGYSPYSLSLANDPEGDAYGKERHYPGKPLIWQKEKSSWEISEEEVRNNLSKFDLYPEKHGIEFISGFIRDTLPNNINKIGKIAALRIDVDAYAATYECLNILYGNIVKGGIIIFDDYVGVEEASRAIDRFQQERKLEFKFIPDKCLGCYTVKE